MTSVFRLYEPSGSNNMARTKTNARRSAVSRVKMVMVEEVHTAEEFDSRIWSRRQEQ